MVDLTQAHKASIELLGTRHNALVEAVRNYVNGSVQPSTDELIAAIEDVTTDIDIKEKMLLGLASRQATRPVPSLILDFKTRHYLQGTRRPEKGYGIHDLLTVERATPKWVYSASGMLTEVPANEPAYQHDPVTGEPEGVLIEGSRTNHVLYSEPDGNNWPITNNPSHWAGNFVTKAGITLDTYIDGAFRRNSVPCTRGCAYSFFFYDDGTKSELGRRQVIFLRLYQGESTLIDARVYYDYTTKTFEFPTASGVTFAKSVYVGDGLYRIVTVLEDDNSDECGFALIGEVNTIGGFQMEPDALTPSSYIPTEDAPVTRAADNVYRELGEEFNPKAFTVVLRGVVSVGAANSGQRLLSINGGTNAQRLTITRTTLITSLAGAADVTSRDVIPNDANIALSWDSTTLTIYVNGTVWYSGEGDINPALFSQMQIGKDPTLGVRGATFSSINILPRALTDQELIELTS